MLIRTIHEHRCRGEGQRRRATGQDPLYLRTLLSDGFESGPRAAGRLALPRSLAVAIGEHVRALPPETQAILEMLAVLDFRLPLAQLGQAAQARLPSAAIEPAVACGLVSWWPDEPTCPVEICHPTVRDAIYARITATRRRTLHARAVSMVSESASWAHRVAALERPDESLAAELERLAGEETASGRLALAATHLQWASGISPGQADLERRLLTAALHLTLAGESRGLTLLPAVEAAASCPLRSCVLAMNALSSGQMVEAERMFGEALAQAREDPDSQPLAAVIAGRLAGTYEILGDGEKVQAFARWALGAGRLDAAAASQARTLVAIGVSQVAGPREALTELEHLQSDPGRVPPADIDGLTIRGWFRLLAGDLGPAVRDLTACLKMARQGATFSLGPRAYFYLALAQYLAGAWDDALFTAEQGFSAVIHSRRHELPLMHLAAACVPAGRGAAGEAERHAALAEEAAASLDYGKESLYAAMARALVCQAAGDYLGMADALNPWRDEEAAPDGRPRLYALLWRPLLAEGLIGSGQLEPAADVVARLRADSRQVGYLRPALAWLDGWLAEQRGDPDQARRIYQRGEGIVGTGSPVYTARLLLAHGRLLRRTGNRKDAAERLRWANAFFAVLRATPFLARTEEELAACHLPVNRAKKQPVLALTSRETEVARLAGQGLSNPEIAAELYISRKAVEYHLGNIYAKCGLQGRRQLRRFVEQWHQPVTV